MNLNDEEILMEGPKGYQAGDFRVRQTPWLTITHSIFIRVHNRCADNLANLRPDWTDERLFQEARRITIAIYQHLVYDEWIPTFLGLYLASSPGTDFGKKNLFETIPILQAQHIH